MNEFINEFGKENFLIVIAVVIAIVLALVIIIFIEKMQEKRARKKQIQRELSNYNQINKPLKKEKEVVYDEEILDYEEPIKETKVVEENVYFEEPKNEVFYVEEKNKEEEAKEKLEEVTKKLIEEDSRLIEHTHFETEQEEKSIISYDELVKASSDIDEKNDRLLEDEGEAAITLEELYQKHVDTQNLIEEQKPEIKVNNPVFEESDKKFKNSEVISPVFGFYNGKVKQEQKPAKEVFDELDKAVGMRDLEAEIEKTEEFLTELKRLKNKLD